MDLDITESPEVLKAWAWAEKHLKQLITAAVVVVVAGLIIGFTLWSRANRREAARFALAEAFYAATQMTPAASESGFAKVATEYGGTPAGAQAGLFAAAALFDAGQFREAQAAFEQFANEHFSSPLVAQALYGKAAALSAQGKTAEAADAYKSVVDQFPQSPLISQARYSLASARAQQGDLNEAISLYEEVARDAARSSLGAEASLRADELQARLPPPVIVPPAATTNAPAVPASSATN